MRPRERQLLVEGRAAGVGARAFDVLLALVERRDRLVTKSELLDLVWPGMVVEENNVQVQISTLRKLLGPQAIATIPGRGYQFTAALDGDAPHRAGAVLPSSMPAASQPRAPTVRRTNLPAELPILYGRDDELRALRSLLAEHRLVTIVGAGGIGKSRLAQAVAHASVEQWPDGVWIGRTRRPVRARAATERGRRRTRLRDRWKRHCTRRAGRRPSAADHAARAGQLRAPARCDRPISRSCPASGTQGYAAGDQSGTAAHAGRAAVSSRAARCAAGRGGTRTRASSGRWRCSRLACGRWTPVSR